MKRSITPATSESKQIGPEDIQLWLLAFQKCVRDRDYAKAAKLFHKNVIGFGTSSNRANDVFALETSDWNHAWPNTLRFEFNLKSSGVMPAPGMFVVALEWLSRSPIIGGTNELGRATLVLCNFDGRLLCVHSHFSTDPSAP